MATKIFRKSRADAAKATIDGQPQQTEKQPEAGGRGVGAHRLLGKLSLLHRTPKTPTPRLNEGFNAMSTPVGYEAASPLVNPTPVVSEGQSRLPSSASFIDRDPARTTSPAPTGTDVTATSADKSRRRERVKENLSKFFRPLSRKADPQKLGVDADGVWSVPPSKQRATLSNKAKADGHPDPSDVPEPVIPRAAGEGLNPQGKWPASLDPRTKSMTQPDDTSSLNDDGFITARDHFSDESSFHSVGTHFDRSSQDSFYTARSDGSFAKQATVPSSSARSDGAAIPANAHVVDPDTHRINAAPLKEVAKALADNLPPLPPGANKIQQQQHRKLFAELALFQAFEPVQSPAAGQQGADHLVLRDHWDQCRKLAASLSNSLKLGPSLVPGAQDRHLAATYGEMGQLFKEFKRYHLSAGAYDLRLGYVMADLKRLEDLMPDLGDRRPGVFMSQQQGGGLSYSSPVGVKVGGEVKRAGIFLVDEDRDYNAWKEWSTKLEAGFGWEKTKLAGGPEAKALLSFRVALGHGFLDTDSLEKFLYLMDEQKAGKRGTQTSASPASRRQQELIQQGSKLFKNFIGRRDVPTVGQPGYLGQDKVSKGFNPTLMHLAAQGVDPRLGQDGRLSAAVQVAYPNVVAVLEQRLQAKQPLPLAPRQIEKSVVVDNKDLWLPAIRTYTLEAMGKLGWKWPLAEAIVQEAGEEKKKDKTQGTLQAGVSAAINVKAKLMQFFLQTEQLPHELLDPGNYKSFKAVQKLFRQIVEVEAQEKPPEFGLYRQTVAALNSPLLGRGTVKQPTSQKFDLINEQLEDLTSKYLHFVHDAQALLTKPDPAASQEVRTALEQKQAQGFDRLNNTLLDGQAPGTLQDALKDATGYVATCYNSLSLGLGYLGHQLSEQNCSAAKQQGLIDVDMREAAEVANAAYRQARKLLDGVYLPIHPTDLATNQVVKAETGWERYHLSFGLNFQGGLPLNILGAANAKLEGKPVEGVGLDNNTGQIVLSCEVQYQKATKQPTDSRRGDFIDMSFNVTGGAPLVDKVVEQAVRSAIRKLNTGIDIPAEKIDAKDVMRQLHGLAVDMTGGKKIQVKLHKEDGIEGWRLQFVRIHQTHSSGLGGAITVPTPVGKFAVSGTNKDFQENPELVVMGSDFSGLSIIHNAYKQLLDGAEGAVQTKERFNEAPYWRDGLFNRPETMLRFLEEYETFYAYKDERAVKGEKFANKFEQLHKGEPFRSAAQEARSAQMYGPGAADPLGPAPEPLTEPPRLERRDFSSLRAQLAGNKTAQEKLDILVDAGVWSDYSKVMDHFTEITSAVARHASKRPGGIATSVRDKPLETSSESGSSPSSLNGEAASTSSGGSTPVQPPTDRAAVAVTEQLQAIQEATPAAKAWLDANGLKVMHNSGGGDCLIKSMLQHLTGNYGSNHDELTKRVRQEMQKRIPSLGDTEWLFPDGEHMQALIASLDKISDELGRPKVQPSFIIPTISAQGGEPPVNYSEQSLPGRDRDAILILQTVNHYEAVTTST